MKRILIITTLLLVLILASCGTSPEPSPVNSPEADTPADTGNPALIDQGKTIFQANCSACHTTTSEDVLVGPSMVGLVTHASKMSDGMDSRGYILQSILEPGAFINEGFQDLMPATYANSLSEEEIDALVDYLMTFD